MSQTRLIVLPLGVVLKSNTVGSSLSSQLTGPWPLPWNSANVIIVKGRRLFDACTVPVDSWRWKTLCECLMEPSDSPWDELSLVGGGEAQGTCRCAVKWCVAWNDTWDSRNSPKCCFKMETTAADYPGRQEAKLHSVYLIFAVSVILEFVSSVLLILNSDTFFIAISY